MGHVSKSSQKNKSKMGNAKLLEKLDERISSRFEYQIICENEAIKSINDNGLKAYYKLNYQGGYYFNDSLQIYGFDSNVEWNFIDKINIKLKENYGDLIQNAFCFASDIFGTQFCIVKNKIYSFNLESAQFNFIANSFIDWIDLLLVDSEFITGCSYKIDFEEKIQEIQLTQKLLPDKPFVLGGEFKIDKLIAYDFLSLIVYNSKIAKQIFNLKNGTSIMIEFEK